MTFQSILPGNAATEQRQREEVLARIENVPVPIANLWKPQTCPDQLLPLLAWTLSVDHWDPYWSTDTKRAVIASAYEVHAHKGTRYAIERALAPLDIRVHLTEWFEQSPPGQPGTFTVELRAEENMVPGNPLTVRAVSNMLSMIRGAKRLSQHLELKMTALMAQSAGIGGGIGWGASVHLDAETQIPIRTATLGLSGLLNFGARASLEMEAP